MSSYGPLASSTRVRLHDWFDHLGLHVAIHGYARTKDNQPRTLARVAGRVAAAELRLRMLPRSLGSATLLLARRATPFSDGALEGRLLRAAGRGIYDVDDALYALEADGTRLRRSPSVWRESVRAADVVIAGNEVLAEHASALNRDVVVIPSCVEPAHYVVKSDYSIGEAPRAVWIGSPSTEAHVRRIESQLLEAHRRFGLRLTVISGGAAPLGALDAMVDRVAWAPGTFARDLVRADVGIMPLEDEPFARGKCGYKLLQYAAAAMPVVGSPVGVNRAILDEFGGLAPADDEWVDALGAVLHGSDRMRADMGARARAGVAASYSFAAWAEVWRRTVGLDAGAREVAA